MNFGTGSGYPVPATNHQFKVSSRQLSKVISDILQCFSNIGVSREGQRGAIAPPKMPKKCIFNNNKKVAPNFHFSALKPAREAYSGHSWVRSPPPSKGVPPPRLSWLRLCLRSSPIPYYFSYVTEKQKKNVFITVPKFDKLTTYAQYTPLTRLNSTVASRRRRQCVLALIPYVAYRVFQKVITIRFNFAITSVNVHRF